MSDVRNLINSILTDEKLKKTMDFNSTVFTDEPILCTANKLSNYVPQEIRDLRKMIVSQQFGYPHEKSFYEQGKSMENYEDDYEFKGDFSRYYPTYQAMDIKQLRGYFSWRTKVRKGIIENASMSFAYVYVYELLNLIGANGAEDGFEKLNSFRKEFMNFHPDINRNLSRWLHDFVIYYNLDKQLLEELEDIDFDKSIEILLNPESNDNLFSAIKELSAYNIERSDFISKNEAEAAEIICRVFRSLTVHYATHGSKSLCERLFGNRVMCSYLMFSAAVFYDTKKYDDYSYKVSDIDTFYCKKGIWTCDRYQGGRGKNQKLGAIVKATDSIMREKYGFAVNLSYEIKEKTIPKIISAEIDRFLEEKRRKALPEISIDVSKLGDIRRAADITRDKLIVEEDTDFIEEIPDEEEQLEEKIIEIKQAEIPAKKTNETPLDETEFVFMQCLLYDKPYNDLLAEKHIMLSVIADSINDKMFDIFGDTVIMFDGDKPEIIEDYAEELKGIIPQ